MPAPPSTHSPERPADPVFVVGVGADGWAGLSPAAREALRTADTVLGSARQLDLLPPEVGADRVAWPMPLLPTLAATLTAAAGRRAVLASGDPTFHGIATTIARLLPDLPLAVIAHPSSLALACARLAWPQQEVEVVSLVGRPLELLHPALQPGRRVLVLLGTADQAPSVAELLTARGYGPSQVTALSSLGGKQEQVFSAPAAGWPAEHPLDPLTVLAIECRAEPAAPRRSRTPGLPDDAYEHDGQLTKRQVRAITLSSLAPSPGELLWDVGGGAGSIGIEWLRQHPANRAVAIERVAERAERIRRNAAALGVPGLRVVVGSAPECLSTEHLGTPSAVFVGGGTTAGGLIETCWAALRPGGRLVVNVTTLESEQVLVAARARYGGELTRIEIARAEPIGRYTGWRPARPVTHWLATKPPEGS